jgi:drug/metabolite transporter (DMT)-like permease
VPRLDRRTLALLLLLVTGTAWGYNWVVMKIAVAYAPPFEFAAMRMLGGGILLALLGLAMRRPMRPELPLRFYLIVGFFQSAGFVGLATWAVVMAGAGKVAVLAYTMPVWTALLAWPVLGERIGASKGAAIVLALAGILCMVGHVGNAWFADVLAVVAGLSWAIGVVYVKRVAGARAIDLYRVSAWQMLCAGAMLAVVAVLAPHAAIVWSPQFVAALAYNVVIANALAYSCWFVVLSVLPASEATMGSLLAPLVGVLAAWLQLGERPSLLEGGGMLLVFAGIAVLGYVRSAPVRT